MCFHLISLLAIFLNCCIGATSKTIMTLHLAIKSVYNGFAKAMKDVPLKLCLLDSLLFKSCLFSESSFVYLGEDILVQLAGTCYPFWD